MDRFYEREDPWGYRKNPADWLRRSIIRAVADNFVAPHPGRVVLDVGCGEGWLTSALSGELYGYELSEKACERMVYNDVRPWKPGDPISDDSFYPINVNRFDLVLMTGVLYKEYDWPHMLSVAMSKASEGTVFITSHILDRESEFALKSLESHGLKQVFQMEFDYHRSEEEKFRQQLRVFRL